MLPRVGGNAAWRAALCALALCVGGCGHLHWPWHHPPPPPPPAPVHELDISGAASPASFPQYWQRNTLLVDLSAASGTGSITLKPAAGTTWPVRLAFRVKPGAIATLEVHGSERTVLPITPGSGKPIDLELAPDIYTPPPAQMTVSWGTAE